MRMLVCDPEEADRMIRRRQRLRQDRFDEVWDGVYVMSPQPNNEHVVIGGLLTYIFHSAIDPGRLGAIAPSGNISDQPDDWSRNYRCPDLAVFLKGSPAEDRGSHWFGGPDFALEIVSPGDRSRKKFEFYAKVGVREVVIVGRKPWRLDLYRPAAGKFAIVGTSDVSRPDPVFSQTLGLTFRLVAGYSRPQIEVTNPTNGLSWLA